MIKRYVAAAAMAWVLVAGLPSAALAQSLTLTWDPSPDAGVAGYKLAYGPASGTYTQEIDVGQQTSYTVTGLDTTKNTYFAVRAYSTTALHSAYSNEVHLPAVVPPPPAPVTTISSLTPNTPGPYVVGQTVTWTTTASNPAGPVQYKYYLYGAKTGWKLAQDWSSSAGFIWAPGPADLGDRTLQVWVRAVGSTAEYEAWVGKSFMVNVQPLALSANVDFPTPAGNPVTWTAVQAGAGSQPLEYRFMQLQQATGQWSVARDYAAANEFTWTPAQVGSYTIEAWASQAGSTAAFEAKASSGTVTVAPGTLSLSLKVDVAFPVLTSTAITWTVRPKGGTAGPLQFQFLRHSAKTGQWTVVKDYSTTTTYTWVPGWGEEGQYTLQVRGRNAGSSASYDATLNSNTFQIDRAPMQLSADALFPLAPGSTATIRAQAGSVGDTLEYQFWLYNQTTGTWTNARSYSTSQTYAWTPASVGSYAFQVWARQVGSSATWDVWRSTNFLEVSQTPAKLEQLAASTALPATAGTPITWTARASGGTAGPLEYCFYLYREGAGWSLLRGYTSNGSVSWTPTVPGTYAVQAWVRSAGSSASYESFRSSGVFVITP